MKSLLSLVVTSLDYYYITRQHLLVNGRRDRIISSRANNIFNMNTALLVEVIS